MNRTVKITREIGIFDAEDVIMEHVIDNIDEFFVDTLHDFESQFKIVCSAEEYTKILQTCAMTLIDELGVVYGIDIGEMNPKPWK